MRSDRSQRNLCSPAVVIDEAHRRFLPGIAANLSEFEVGGEEIVSILEDVGSDDEEVTCFSFHCVSPAVDDGANVLDQDAARRTLALHDMFK
jgi:hypothetical protein